MKYFKIIFFLLLFQVAFSQQDIFDIARKGTVEEVKIAMKQNPDIINSVNVEGYSPLILASYRGNVPVAIFLINNVKDINGSSSMGTPLMAAVVKGNKEIAQALLDSKADPNITDQNGTTALIYAAIFKHYEIVEMLLKASAILDLKDIRGNSAADYARISNDEKLTQLLKTN
jgi:ankyrin repeat protein